MWVLKPWLFKHPHNLSRIRSNKPILLRSPIILSVGRSLHHNGVPSESCYDSDESDLTEEPANNEVVNIECNSNSIRLGKYLRKPKLKQLHDRQPNDLWSLIDDCSNMSLMRCESSNCQRPHRSKRNQDPSSHPPIIDNDSVNEVAQNRGNVSANANTVNCSSSSCSQQARMPSNNCDVTMDELASYFETFVHIPKKMSSMAEMMYI